MKASLGRMSALPLAGLLLALVVTGCSSGDKPAKKADKPAAAPAAEATAPAATDKPKSVGTEHIKITDSAFVPAELTVPLNTTVTWTNAGSQNHNITFRANSRTSGEIKPGVSASHLFDTPGVWQYMDVYHSEMQGVVIVK